MRATTFPQRWRTSVAGLSVGLAVLAMTACGAAGSDSMTSDGSGEAASGRAGGVAVDEGAAAVEGAQTEEGAEDGTGALGSGVEAADRALIHTATMSVRVQDVEEGAQSAARLTVEAGGYVSSEHLSTPLGGSPTATLTLRVPAEDYEETLTGLAELGDRSSLERSVADVTEEVADVESRVASAETALETLRGYLEEAEDVDDLLRVEQEIQNRQSELEAFQARWETLNDQTAYSTVNLSLDSPDTYVDSPSGEAVGFLEALGQGWAALAAVALWIAVIAGWAFPFLVVAAVVGVPLWWYLRRRARAARTTSGRDRAPERTDGSVDATTAADRGSDGNGSDTGDGIGSPGPNGSD
ncbi:hypothetical protein BJF83_09945 [Nocardiopsis sp. CNR-923]|uniref:DUF4349 domain-containing protein n=1 Tax=Nocardiopsis sp. CNR-923 TaxID=1904965 RepID=UPI00096287A4|nr:DUF4349 domain-containing protein [Nocardiopsis sp. CNR-923]OLT29988.1 hypothetical protein BJF83_09945 [Nocardiopsis sp. CNR-923]